MSAIPFNRELSFEYGVAAPMVAGGGMAARHVPEHVVAKHFCEPRRVVTVNERRVHLPDQGFVRMLCHLTRPSC